ncbi:hypothetical protein [Tersicoccus solisilvae]|uniref:hypothetical protein n=1 Tax=Tersicoccus solisilvae TaxID=1882339 RepID=UPI001E5F5161|nr:hypothetical protein [Tersicoccus solisilvae]
MSQNSRCRFAHSTEPETRETAASIWWWLVIAMAITASLNAPVRSRVSAGLPALALAPTARAASILTVAPARDQTGRQLT